MQTEKQTKIKTLEKGYGCLLIVYVEREELKQE